MKQRIDAGMKPRLNRIFPFSFSSEGKLFQVVAEIPDEPGALRSLLQALQRRLNLVGSSTYAVEGDGAIFSCFARPLSKSESVGTLNELLSKDPSVKAFHVWEDEGGLLIDRFHRGLQSDMGETYTLLSRKGLCLVFEKVVQTFGSGGVVILYLQGLEYGKQRLTQVKRTMSPELPKALDQLSEFWAALGFGSATINMDKAGRINLAVDDCFESAVPTNCGRRCSFMRGLFTGALEVVAGREYDCEEVRCRLKEDGRCEFVLTPRTQP